jgi:hypothetical protein
MVKFCFLMKFGGLNQVDCSPWDVIQVRVINRGRRRNDNLKEYSAHWSGWTRMTSRNKVSVLFLLATMRVAQYKIRCLRNRQCMNARRS